MTQLRILLEYFNEVPWFKRQRQSYEFLSKIVSHCESLDASSNEYYLTVINDLIRLYDSIVTGLNTGRFEYSSSVFSARSASRLPKIYNGLLSCIFDKKGNLRDDYSATAVQTLLEGLVMIKRIRIEGSSEKARTSAVQKFSDSQRRSRYYDPNVVDAIAVYWGLMEKRIIERNLFRLGSCGSGVTLDMAFPWVPRLQLPWPDSMPNRPAKVFLTQCLDNKVGVNFDRLPFPDSKGFDLIRFYHWKPRRVVRLVTVPKSALTDRPITVTDTFSTILGASFRLSCMAAAETLGLMTMVNVFNQKHSRRLLRRRYRSVYCYDAADGSTCITKVVNRRLLKKAPILADVISACEPHVYYDDLDKDKTESEITTITMGDAFTVADLSFTMLFSAIYGQWCTDTVVPVGTIPTEEEAFESITSAIALGLIAVVGDDLIYSRHAHAKTILTLQSIGIERNEKKSSYPLANFQESCGSWFVWNPQTQSHIEIAPYRLYTDDEDKYVESMSVSEYLRRMYDVSSPNMVAAAIAIAKVHPELSDTIKYESYNSDELGSVIGNRPRKYSFCKRNDRRVSLDDTISFLFGLESRGVSPRRSKRVPRVRYRKRRITEHSCTGPFHHNNGQSSFDSTVTSDSPEVSLTYMDIKRFDNMIHSWSVAHRERCAFVIDQIDSLT